MLTGLGFTLTKLQSGMQVLRTIRVGITLTKLRYRSANMFATADGFPTIILEANNQVHCKTHQDTWQWNGKISGTTPNSCNLFFFTSHVLSLFLYVLCLSNPLVLKSCEEKFFATALFQMVHKVLYCSTSEHDLVIAISSAHKPKLPSSVFYSFVFSQWFDWSVNKIFNGFEIEEEYHRCHASKTHKDTENEFWCDLHFQSLNLQ